jgi:hypothetical protein
MNAAPHNDDAFPPLDVAAWRGVLRGLQLVRVGLGLGLVSAVASCVCCVPLALMFAFSASWWRQSLGVLVVGINLGSPILINIGMAFDLFHRQWHKSASRISDRSLRGVG